MRTSQWYEIRKRSIRCYVVASLIVGITGASFAFRAWHPEDPLATVSLLAHLINIAMVVMLTMATRAQSIPVL